MAEYFAQQGEENKNVVANGYDSIGNVPVGEFYSELSSNVIEVSQRAESEAIMM